MAGKIAIVQRGKIPIVTKALHVQRAGAIACIILDNGICREFDQHCVPGSDKKKGDRFAVSDHPVDWYDSNFSPFPPSHSNHVGLKSEFLWY